MDRSLLAALAAAALLLAAPGCFDETPDPTQGFVAVGTGGVPGAEVIVDGESRGVAATVGPLDAGEHTVTVRRAGYDVDPAERIVRVEPAKTARADFTLTLGTAGAVRVTATDELRLTEVAGGEILADIGAGFAPTGVTTPGIVPGLPPGPVQFRVRKAGFADSDPVTADVAVADTVDTAVELGPPRAVLAEMFTYVICPNCPPAAEHLDAMHEAAPRQVFVLEYHTWAGLPLYDPRWAAREDYYTGGPSVGWPATVFQGGANDTPALIVGSNPSELLEFDARAAAELAACGNDCPVALVVDGSIGTASADVTVRMRWRGGTLPSSLRLRVALLEDDVVAPGNQPAFGFVVREFSDQAVVVPAAGEVWVQPVSLPVNAAWSLDALDVVAFVQSDATREILAVASLD